MNFKIEKQKESITSLIRRLGYVLAHRTPQGELSCVRRLGADYPRFHAYLKEEGDGLVFSLHLDQKRPSYEGTAAHGGDYDSETVVEEKDRILGLLKNEGGGGSGAFVAPGPVKR